MNATNKAIILSGGIILFVLFLFPPWYETNGQYVQELGIHFLLQKPEAVPVPCYLVGCVTAPASYFHVVLDQRRRLAALSTIVVVATLLLLLFRTRADGTVPSIRNSSTRWIFSGLVALALPVRVPPQLFLLGMYGIDVPRVLFSGEFGSLAYGVFFLVVFCIYTGVVYLAATAFEWIMARKNRGVSSAS